MEVPQPVSHYASKIRDPVALAGCRNSDRGLDCCEYDLIVFSPEAFPPRLDVVEGYTIEVVQLNRERSMMPELIDAQMLNTLDLRYDPISPEDRRKRSRKILNALGRKSIAKCLMLQKKSQDAAKNPFVSAAWLKSAAYYYTRGLLQISGSRPMPAHELEQLRELGQNRKLAAELDIGFDAIGLGNATRQSISRVKKAASELLAKQYDVELILEKTDSLQEKQKLTDAFYYLGRVLCDRLNENESALLVYPKIVQVALCMSTDQNEIQKLRSELFRAAAMTLKKQISE